MCKINVLMSHILTLNLASQLVLSVLYSSRVFKIIFELRKWIFEGGTRQMVIKLKPRMMDGMKVKILRDYIKCV